jgi:hypothetical protein
LLDDPEVDYEETDLILFFYEEIYLNEISRRFFIVFRRIPRKGSLISFGIFYKINFLS